MLPDFPAHWTVRLERLAHQYRMQCRYVEDAWLLSGNSITLSVRPAGDPAFRWAVFALRLLDGEQTAGLDEALHFASLNHRLMHTHDVPFVVAWNARDRAWEALFQLVLDGLPDDELDICLSLYLQTVHAVIDAAMEGFAPMRPSDHSHI